MKWELTVLKVCLPTGHELRSHRVLGLLDSVNGNETNNNFGDGIALNNIA